MKNNNSILRVFRNEFQKMFSDRAVLASFFVLSVLVAVLYSYVYSREITTDTPIAVVDECRTAESRQLIRMLDATEQVAVTESPADFKAAEKLFYNQEVKGIVLIPKDFSEKIYRKEQPSVSGYYDVSYFPYYKQVYKAVATTVAYLNGGIELKGLTAQGMSEAQASDTMSAIKAESVTLFNPNAGYGMFLMPMVFMIIIQTLLLTGIGLLGGTQREKGIAISGNGSLLETLHIVLGKASSYLVVGLLYISIVLWIVIPSFNLPQRGNLTDIYGFLLPYLLSLSFLGLWLVRFFKHREDVVLTISFTSIPVAMLSGVSWPVEAFPSVLRYLAELVPSTHAVKGFVALSQSGVKLSEIQELYTKMWLLCLFYFILTMIFYHRWGKQMESKK